MNPKPGTTRYEKLCDFLTESMEDKKASRRIRLSAAMRLDDLLKRQERQHEREARRAEREHQQAAKREAEASAAVEAVPSEDPAASQLRRARELIQQVSKRNESQSVA